MKIDRSVRVLMIVVAAASAACAARQPGSASPTGSREVLSHAEMEQSAYRDAELYETIRALRPDFLTGRTSIQRTTANQPVAVFVDGKRMGSVEVLRDIRAARVDEG